MLSKLRRKIATINVVFAAAVLLVVGVAILYSDYHQHDQAIRESLRHSLEIDANGGQGIPGQMDGPMRLQADQGDGSAADDFGAGQPEATSETDDDSITLEPQEPMGSAGMGPERRDGAGQLVATSVYRVDSDYVVTERIDGISLDSDTVKTALGIVLAKASDSEGAGELQGTIPSMGLYYLADVADDGSMTVAFASGDYITQSFLPLFRVLILVFIVALACFMAISVALSRLAVRPVADAWQQQQQFVADASHELKTPLAVILANNAILMSDPESTVSSQMKWVESTENEAHLMQGLVNDMLYLAQTENTRGEVEYDAVDFSDIVEGTALQFESVAFERNVMIDAEVTSGLFVKGDPARLHRLVGTLVDNACKYADEGGQVKVGLEDAGRKCRLRVSNTGTVIPEEDLPHLFDRFYRSDKARTQGTGGFGLGLSIAKGIVDSAGGHISVTSTPTEGTTFTVELPLN